MSHALGRVAVVIPVYRARFLAQALESVFLQSRPVDEVIVVDDGSPDQRELQLALAPYGGRVRLLRQSNQGAAAARNAAIAATRAPLVALLDADDRWLPDFVAGQLATFERDPRLDLAYTDGLFIGDSPLAGRTFMSTCPSTGAVTLERLLAQQCTVLCSGVVARREAITSAGGFDPSLRRGHDFDLWLRMAARGSRMAYGRRVLVLRRIHADNLSGTGSVEVARPLQVIERAVERLPLSRSERRAALRRVIRLRRALACERGKELLLRGDVRAARMSFGEAMEGPLAWKLQAVQVGLWIAPALVRRVYQARVASAASWAR